MQLLGSAHLGPIARLQQAGEAMNRRFRLSGLAAGAALALAILGLAASGASAQPAPHYCGGVGTKKPVIQPVISGSLGYDRSNPGFDCQMWQAFVYLNWPAAPGKPGVPNPAAKFGAAAPTVWETYKTIDQVFLPGGVAPAPWGKIFPQNELGAHRVAMVESGNLLVLKSTSEISDEVITALSRGASPSETTILGGIEQAGGGILYDQQRVPVYYEINLNQDEFDYIVQHALYNAKSQLAYAASNVIALPQGNGAQSAGAIETKAAWKLLTPAEIKSGRFHMREALIPGRLTPVVVGLVGFHIFQTLTGMDQGVWATFEQIDNAPITGQPVAKSYTFNNPSCPPEKCPVNTKNPKGDTTPTQVVQIAPNDQSASSVSAMMQAMIKQADPTSPWQYYKLVNVQWPVTPVDITKSPTPLSAPLPNGAPNDLSILNAVLETFFQSKPNFGCLSCHENASVAPDGAPKPPNWATSYSFVFERAK
jgi:hypothetical protein